MSGRGPTRRRVARVDGVCRAWGRAWRRVNKCFRDLKNSGDFSLYHNQGVKKLAQRFMPIAFAPDGLVEGFYDPDAYYPGERKFIMGLQFHPERMRKPDSDEFDYPGCPAAYREFAKAVVTYQKRLNSATSMPRCLKLDQEMEKKRKVIVRSFSWHIYVAGNERNPFKDSELALGADFLESNTALSLQHHTRLKQMGANFKNSSSYSQRLKKFNAAGEGKVSEKCDGENVN